MVIVLNTRGLPDAEWTKYFCCKLLSTQLWILIALAQGELMGELDKDASTKKLSPYVHTACEARSLCSHSLWNATLPESGYCTAPVFTGSDSLHCQLFV